MPAPSSTRMTEMPAPATEPAKIAGHATAERVAAEFTAAPAS